MHMILNEHRKECAGGGDVLGETRFVERLSNNNVFDSVEYGGDVVGISRAGDVSVNVLFVVVVLCLKLVLHKVRAGVVCLLAVIIGEANGKRHSCNLFRKEIALV